MGKNKKSPQWNVYGKRIGEEKATGLILRPSILLHPQIPKPLHGLAPRVVLGDEWWRRERLAAQEHSQYCCLACGIPRNKAKYHQWLEGHEQYQIDYQAGRVVYIETVALCHSCHNFIHRGRMEALVRKGLFSKAKYNSILKHGISLVKRAGLTLPPIPKHTAPWSHWRLVINGREYPGKFRSFEHWQQVYGRR